MTETYKIPLQKLGDFLASFDSKTADDIRTHIDQKLGKLDDAPAWPDALYDYTQGRIREYENWIDSLSKEDAEKEIAACRARYAAKYQMRLDCAEQYVRENRLNPVRSPMHAFKDRISISKGFENDR